MQVQNQTPFAVKVQIVEPRNERLASVIVKSTYDLHGDLSAASARLAPEQLPLIAGYLPTTYRTFHGETFFRKQGSDVCVLGTLKRDKPVTRARATLSVAGRQSSLEVFGVRIWIRDAANRDQLFTEPSRAISRDAARLRPRAWRAQELRRRHGRALFR